MKMKRKRIFRYNERTEEYKILEVNGQFISITFGKKGKKEDTIKLSFKLTDGEMSIIAEILKYNALIVVDREMEEDIKRREKKRKNENSSVEDIPTIERFETV